MPKNVKQDPKREDKKEEEKNGKQNKTDDQVDDPKVSVIEKKVPSQTTLSTPTTATKRDASSPLDQLDAKKQLLYDSPKDAEMETDAETGSAPDQKDKTPAFKFSKDDMSTIANLIKESFHDELINFTKEIVDVVAKQLDKRMSKIETENARLVKENKELKNALSDLELRIDEQEQYGRRNCLRISGIKEEVTENTDKLILDISNKLNVPLTKSDIDRSHRVGKSDSSRSTPRSIIVKFAPYRARESLYQKRFDLKNYGYGRVYINEDLTKRRNNLLYKARLLVKDGKLKSAKSSDGRVIVKDKHGNFHRVLTDSDLSDFF